MNPDGDKEPVSVADVARDDLLLDAIAAGRQPGTADELTRILVEGSQRYRAEPPVGHPWWLRWRWVLGLAVGDLRSQRRRRLWRFWRWLR